MKARSCVFAMAILVVWGLSVSSNYAKIDLKENAVAVWSFDEGSGNKVKDGSGNGNDGELQGGPKWIKGKYGQALDFNGVGAYVNIKSNPRFVPKSNQVTAVAWVFMKGVGKVSIVENNADNWGIRFSSIPKLDAYVTISVAEKLETRTGRECPAKRVGSCRFRVGWKDWKALCQWQGKSECPHGW